MCRSIKTLRPPITPEVTDEDVRAAALQYVRKVSGFRAPAAHNREVFDQAVAAVAAATQELLDGLQVRGSAAAHRPPRAHAEPHTRSHPHADAHTHAHQH
ncbi:MULTISPECIES: DUF2277 domain-containing protein [unclassified Streptomyces]|uniref:DUF2277 domain-containing protein n=1 Tax=unclassified Streptomyces TaxID=2593676 RepID=UPI0038114EB4